MHFPGTAWLRTECRVPGLQACHVSLSEARSQAQSGFAKGLLRTRGVIQKSLPPREFSPPLCHCAEGRQSPRQPILETVLAPLQVVLGSFRHGHPTLSPKTSVARSQVFPTPREAWISSPWLPHLGTAFRRFQAEAPKWATKLPLETTELGCQVRLLIMVHASVQRKWQNSLGGRLLWITPLYKAVATGAFRQFPVILVAARPHHSSRKFKRVDSSREPSVNKGH
jgi:hypothetical protein